MMILSSIVSFTHHSTIFNFSQAYTLLFDTLLHKNYIAVSKSALAHFIMYNSFAPTEWKIFSFLFLFDLIFVV